MDNKRIYILREQYITPIYLLLLTLKSSGLNFGNKTYSYKQKQVASVLCKSRSNGKAVVFHWLTLSCFLFSCVYFSKKIWSFVAQNVECVSDFFFQLFFCPSLLENPPSRSLHRGVMNFYLVLQTAILSFKQLTKSRVMYIRRGIMRKNVNVARRFIFRVHEITMRNAFSRNCRMRNMSQQVLSALRALLFSMIVYIQTSVSNSLFMKKWTLLTVRRINLQQFPYQQFPFICPNWVAFFVHSAFFPVRKSIFKRNLLSKSFKLNVLRINQVYEKKWQFILIAVIANYRYARNILMFNLLGRYCESVSVSVVAEL